MSLNNLFRVLKGGAGSGNRGHAGIPGHRGGSAPTGSLVVGSVGGNKMYKIEGLHIPDDLVNVASMILISPKGDLYIAKNETATKPRHDMMVDVLGDMEKYDYYSRAEVTKDHKGNLTLNFGTYGVGVGDVETITERHDKLAEKKFGKLAAQMLNSGYSPDMPVRWMTSDDTLVKSSLESWA